MNQKGWIRPYFKIHRWRFLMIIAFSLLTGICASALMFTSGYLISKSAMRPENILMVYVPVVLVRTFGIGRAVVHYVERLVGHDVVLRILAKMRVRLYRILEPQAFFIRSHYRTGDILGTLAEDIEQLQDVYVRTVFPTLAAIVMYAICIAMFGWFDIPFALLMALYIFMIILILPLASLWFMHAKHKQIKQERNGLYQKLTDAVLGIGDWMISGRSAQFVQSYESDEKRVTLLERSVRKWARFRTLIAQSIVGIAVISTTYWAGQQFADGQLAAEMIAAFALFIFALMDIFLPVSEAVEKIPQYRDSLDRLDRLDRSQPAEPSQAPMVSEEVLHKATHQAHLRVERASYRYDDSAEWSLDNVSLDIPQGKKIAVIGRSGAGKSTLLKMIQGVITPQRGRATINGVDANRFGEDLSRVIAVLNQRPHLFDTTVANNIRLGRQEASDEEIRKVAKQVKLHELIESLPQGYRTPILETGQRFSGGERQRIALARILLQNTPVVILDEPTVGLDPRTERDLLRTIFEAIQGKTLIWITHHLIGVEQMDEVIFIEDGQMEMRGTHAELMERVPRYHHLYHLDRPFMAKTSEPAGSSDEGDHAIIT